MLEELLRLVGCGRGGGIRSYEELAEGLSVSLPLVEAMLENLAQAGYLRPVQGACAEECSACAGGCSVAGHGRLWALTEKGARAAGQAFS